MELNTSLVNKALQYAYDKAINGCEVNGIRLLDSAADLAMSYNNPNRTVRQNATSLINWQCSKSAASGFATAFGGFAVMAVGLPANLTSVLYVQLRMIAAIAILAGYDPHDDQVQTYAYICLTGSSAHEFVKNLGVKIGEAYANKTIQKKISGEMLKKINQAVGNRIVTKFGNKGVVNLGKMVPVFGALIGAGADALSTKAIGSIAKKIFIDGKM